MEEQDKGGLSRNILAALLVLAIILSVIGTYMSIVHADIAPMGSGSPGSGHVGVFVLPARQAHVGLVVVNTPKENSKENKE